jgi:predicted oxidoreductase
MYTHVSKCKNNKRKEKKKHKCEYYTSKTSQTIIESKDNELAEMSDKKFRILLLKMTRNLKEDLNQ